MEGDGETLGAGVKHTNDPSKSTHSNSQGLLSHSDIFKKDEQATSVSHVVKP